ncbi:MAG: fimbrillin family protein [Bacteroidaceae bacterium]|nr:fimbrillin family protein [Bacteroidaceae bacterium]
MKLKHITLCLSLLALAACKEDALVVETPPIPDSEKTPIELSVGGVDSPNPITRAVITKPKTDMQSFTENTSLYMLMKSEHVTDNSKVAKVTRTVMFAQPQTDTSKDYSEVNYSETATEKNEYDKFVRFWDDSYARESALSILAICTPGMGYGVDLKAWRTGGDNAYANIPWTNINGDDQYPSIFWPIAHNTGVTDQLSYSKDKKNRDVSFIKNQDLCFSNNIGDWSGKGDADRRLKFDPVTKKFPRAEDQWGDGAYKTRMIFYHALSKLTFRIKMGEGFTADQFVFPTGYNIALSNFYNYGKFKIEDGEFDGNTLTSSVIQKIYQRTDAELTSDEKSTYKYILDALVIPGTDMNGSNASTTDAVTFTIANNQYKLSMAQLYSAFSDAQKSGYFDNGKLKAGVHYVFTFSVSKTSIKNLTASIVDWEDVEASELEASNARIKLNLEERNNGDNSNVLGSGDAFTIYRAADDNTGAINDDYAAYNWTKNYSNADANLGFVAATGTTPAHWKTDWYWDSNKNFYHFRALCQAHGTSSKIAVATELSTETAGDYLVLSHSESNYADILWGAPMLDYAQNETNDSVNLKWNYGPTSKGFDGKEGATSHQIYKAIGPTEDAIKLTLFHMMSDVTFNIKTSGESDPDKVNLGNGTTEKTTIELKKIHTAGKLYLGNGLVKGSTSEVANSTFKFEATPAPNSSTKIITWAGYGAIPQDLANVQLVITTPDHNQYIVDLADVVVKSITYDNLANPYKQITEEGPNKDKYQLNRWYPGFKYNYTFKLTKKGITDIQATIVPWETVEAEQEVQIR